SVVTAAPGVMLAIVLIGATSALVGKLLKSVQVDAKLRLGCSTTGQMSFMLMQAGLGYFAAAITHLILHGFYKAYLFLSVGEEIDHTSPTAPTHARSGLSAGGIVVTGVTAIGGGLLFVFLTGKGTRLDSGLLLTGLIVLTTLHATRSALRARMLPARYRYAAITLVVLPAIAIYAGVYTAVGQLMADLSVVTAPTTLTAVHGVVALAFLGVYLAIETGVYRHSTRLYVALVNATRPPAQTLLTAPEEYHES
ncbi:MAG: proton-conducting transporter membrane subunit, partial [Salinarchaeum sp.]